MLQERASKLEVTFSIVGALIRKMSTPDAVSIGQYIIHAIKSLAISTGRLKRSPALHSQPIDVVVYDGPSSPKGTETLS